MDTIPEAKPTYSIFDPFGHEFPADTEAFFAAPLKAIPASIVLEGVLSATFSTPCSRYLVYGRVRRDQSSGPGEGPASAGLEELRMRQ